MTQIKTKQKVKINQNNTKEDAKQHPPHINKNNPQRRLRTNMKLKPLYIITITFILFLAACDSEKIDTNMAEELSDFEFTTQDNDKFGLKNLEGKWWITYFMYTNCTMVCPTTTANMISLQKEFQKENIELPIVSFTTDPDYDTPEVLKEYAHEHGADLNHWTFLTGYDFEEIKELSNESFKVALENGGKGQMEIVHTTNFFLVNPEGKIVKKYDGISKEELKVLADDVKTILK